MAHRKDHRPRGESVGAADVRSRFDELLDRVEEGECFEILSHNRPIARLVPTGAIGKHEVSEEVLARLRSFAKSTKPMTKPELLASRHTEHRI